MTAVQSTEALSTSAIAPVLRLGPVFDDQSFSVYGGPPGVAAWGVGTINGVDAVAFATDPGVQGGALDRATCDTILDAYTASHRLGGLPVVGIWHSGGAHIGGGVESLDGVGRLMAMMTRSSGVVPQISVVLGPAAGGAAYGPALTDIVISGPDGRIFVTGPDVIRSVTGEHVDMAHLGGPATHERQSGVVHVATRSDADAYGTARTLVGLLGAPGAVGPADDRAFADLVPGSSRRAYDMHPIVLSLLDERGIELQPRWAPNIMTVLGRLGGGTVGVVASNPLRLAGCLDAAAADKAARFVRMCDAFGVPLVVLVDVPGYLPGVKQEWDGVVRRGAKLLHAFTEAAVPRVTVVLRKAYGGAYIAMNSRALGADHVFAWPGAEIAVMGPVAAVRVLHRSKLAAVNTSEREALETVLAAEHERSGGGVDRAIELGVVDEVIDPDRTRSAVAAALAALPEYHGNHGNIPL
jgi:acetyl-CoA/propionyl-CoA carboxylase carboxyl transferase subunit